MQVEAELQVTQPAMATLHSWQLPATRAYELLLQAVHTVDEEHVEHAVIRLLQAVHTELFGA